MIIIDIILFNFVSENIYKPVPKSQKNINKLLLRNYLLFRVSKYLNVSIDLISLYFISKFSENIYKRVPKSKIINTLLLKYRLIFHLAKY